MTRQQDLTLVAGGRHSEPAPASRGPKSRASDEHLPAPVVRPFGEFERRYYEEEERSAKVAPEWALDHLTKALDQSGAKCLSLDVFDTLLLRNGKSERRRFWEISGLWADWLSQAGCAPKAQVEDVFKARLRAAQICYSCGPLVLSTQEGRLDNIVEISLSLLGLPPTEAAKLAELEILYEADNTTLNPLVAELVAHYRETGGSVILVSDMYMPAREIVELLRLRGLPEDYADRIFSSADTVVNKRTGTIFNDIAGKLGLEPETFFHVGDNFRSDYAMPRLFGWAAQHLPIPWAEEHLRAKDEQVFRAEVERGLHLEQA
ncbi:MAG: HAD family hydrolase [Phenylobacterium sp.]